MIEPLKRYKIIKRTYSNYNDEVRENTLYSFPNQLDIFNKINELTREINTIKSLIEPSSH